MNTDYYSQESTDVYSGYMGPETRQRLHSSYKEQEYKPNEENFSLYDRDIDDISKEKQKENMINNIKYVLFYALSFAVAMGINDVVTSTFDSFPNTNHFVSKVTYVIILFTITIYVAYLMKGKINM